MNCNIVINQQPSASDRYATETKAKDQNRNEAAHRDQENYMNQTKTKGKAFKR